MYVTGFRSAPRCALARPRAFRSRPRPFSAVRGTHLRLAATRQPSTAPSTASSCVEEGTQLFNDKNYSEALKMYQRAMDLSPNDDEARAAQYNAACALTKLQRWGEAVAALKSAVNDYNLKVSVIYKDTDLTALRERREFIDSQDELDGALRSDTRRTLRAEAKAPFRLARTVVSGGLAFGAALGLAVICTKLIAIAGGAPDAPDLSETLQNFAINLTAVVVFGSILRWDLGNKRRDENKVEQEERLGRLQVSMKDGRVLPLSRLRGTVRPLILAGSKGFLNKCMREVKPYRQDLQARGGVLMSEFDHLLNTLDRFQCLLRKLHAGLRQLCASESLCITVVDGEVLPIVLSDEDPEAALKSLKRDPTFASSAKGFATEQTAVAGSAAAKETIQKGQLVAHDVSEWSTWLREVNEEKGLKADSFYIQVQLDGAVRTSGTNMPNFAKLVDDIPPLDDIRTGFMDGIGPQND